MRKKRTKKLVIKMGIKILKILILINFLFGCKTIRETKMLKEAVKQGVPETSMWVGHKDGGQWVSFVFTQNDSIFHIDTYNDYTNEFGSRYTYKVVCPSIKEKEIRKAFISTGIKEAFWDTKSIVFKCLEFIEKKTEK